MTTCLSFLRRLLAVVLLVAPCRGGLLVEESFDYGVGGLTGLAGGSGWAAAWTQDGEACRVTTDSLAYMDASLHSLVTRGRTLDTAGPATTRSFRTVANGPLDNVWISFLYRLPAANSLYEGVNFFLGSSSIFAVSNSSISSDATITLNNFTTNQGVSSGRGEFGRTHFIVLHVIDGGGANDRVELFVDPPLTGPAGDPEAAIEAASLGFDRVRIAGQNGASLQVDELRIGETFDDVAPHDDLDADGDGLTNEQEIELGLDPLVSDLALIQAIRDHAGYFDLVTPQDIRGQAGSGVVVEASDGIAGLFFEIQQSPDLSAWKLQESVRRTVELPAGKNFIRLQLGPPSP
ncbi:hypothetical protein [Haloferula sargassicola]|uniref:Uncharacterized protein n=1 Tax=Haloferula sargassicola TaxID=490096 RepID=A0ABP9UNI8_9BACT